jgi:peroxiredoxin
MKGDVAKLYGAWNEAAGVAERVTVVVDSAGKIAYVQHNGFGEARDPKEAIAAIA